MRISVVAILCTVCLNAGPLAQTPPSQTPSSTPAPGAPPLLPIPTRAPRPQTVAPAPPPSAPTNRTRPLSGPPIPLPPLAADSDIKEYHAKPGETNAHFTFNLTNTSSTTLQVFNIGTSCGCTIAKAPSQPWAIAPGAGGPVEVDLDLRGRRGLLTKAVYLYSAGYAPKVLTVKAQIPETTGGLGPDRDRNVQIATADRQAVFRGDCARCHATPATGKSGAELYAAACAVCHDAEHRASFVPDLRNLPHTTNRDHWKVWITHGKPGTLMPAFTQSQGGPLSSAQIDSLVNHLATSVPSRPGLPNPPPPPAPKPLAPIE